MKYDFDEICDRTNTSCSKWDLVKNIFGSEDVIPMWVADMDFPVAKPILKALQERAKHQFFGYTYANESVVNAVVGRMQRKFNWKIQPEWVVFTPGVIPALSVAVRTITHPGDAIILQEPVYYPFFSVVTNSGCQMAHNNLKFVKNHYEMDYPGLENLYHPRTGTQGVPGRIKGMILCNPHNPIGRVWNEKELTRLGEVIIKEAGIVISDEIHCEILMKGNRHTPFASISEEFAQNSVVCMAPSKTFNLAGLEASSIIIPNKKLRQNFQNTMGGVLPRPNVFGYAALEAAYRYGDEWLVQVLDYLQANLDFMLKYFERRIPRIKVIKPQGTYLVWMDCRKLKMDNQQLRQFFREQAKVGFDDGFVFGAGGSGFERINIACPRPLLEEALGRIERAVNNL